VHEGDPQPRLVSACSKDGEHRGPDGGEARELLRRGLEPCEVDPLGLPQGFAEELILAGEVVLSTPVDQPDSTATARVVAASRPSRPITRRAA
jgi:hypothetical protein